MKKYYTRVCNFAYGKFSIELVRKKKNLPLNGNKKISFGQIEILTRTSIKKIDDLHKLAKALLTYETLSGDEIENLINKNIYPSNKEDLKVEDEDKGSALSSMGLKPKIVH